MWRSFDVEIESRHEELPRPSAQSGLSREETLGLVRSLGERADVTVEIRPQDAGDKLLVGLNRDRAYLVYHQAGDILFQFSRQSTSGGLVRFVVGGQETQMDARLLVETDDAVAALDEVLRESALPTRSAYGVWEGL
jgi:hypothetical protein